MGMIRAACVASLLLACVPASRAQDFNEGFTRGDLEDWERRSTEDERKRVERMDEAARKREQQRQSQGLQPGQAGPPEALEETPDGRPVPRGEAGPAHLQDLIDAAEEEKLRAPRDAVNHMAVVKAPGAIAITEAYYNHVYCNGNASDGDTSQMLETIRKGLETPRGWGSFPTVEFGWLPEPVLGTWSGGKIVLKIPSLAVLSHEVRHHNDGSWVPPLDGNGRLTGPPTPENVRQAAESYAYATMTQEFGGGDYVHCQPRPLRSPARS